MGLSRLDFLEDFEELRPFFALYEDGHVAIALAPQPVELRNDMTGLVLAYDEIVKVMWEHDAISDGWIRWGEKDLVRIAATHLWWKT
jgi:hypothetical protein